MKTKLFLMAMLTFLSAMFLGCKDQNCDSKSLPDAFILPVNQIALYAGIDNPVYIYINGVKSKNFTVDIKGGSLTPNTDGKTNSYMYLIKPDPKFETVDIAVSDKSNKREVLYTKSFKIVQIPYPIATIANKREGLISKNELLEAAEINVTIENFMYEAFCTVKSFNMVLSQPTEERKVIDKQTGEIDLEFVYEGGMYDCQSSDKKLTSEMLAVIENAPIGTRIWFENIAIESSIDKQIKQIAPIFLRLN